MIDRMRKIISTINIETLLKKAEINFSNENPLDSLLPLEFFEDKDFDIFTALEWLDKVKDKENPERYLYIQGVDLQRDKEAHGTWKRVFINFYNEKIEKYEGIWGTWKRVFINFYNEKIEKYEGIWDENKEEKESCSLSKIYLLFIDQIQDMNEDMRKRLQNNIKK